MRSEDHAGRPVKVGEVVPLPVHLVGNVNLDVVVGPVEPWPQAGTERIVTRLEVRVGGAAGVTALALQALGASFRLHAHVGDDAAGELVRRELGPAGEQLVAAAAGTAVSVGVTHPDGERTFLTYLGHLVELDVPALAAELERSRPGLVLVCGYFLLPRLRRGGGLELMRRARKAGHRLLLDPGWPSDGFTQEVRDELNGLLPWTDVILPNEAEARGWSGVAGVSDAAARLERTGARVVVKRGRAGAAWLERGALVAAGAPEVRVRDSVGAGDCFNAAVLAGLSRGRLLREAAREAVGYAARVIGRSPRSFAP